MFAACARARPSCLAVQDFIQTVCDVAVEKYCFLQYVSTCDRVIVPRHTGRCGQVVDKVGAAAHVPTKDDVAFYRSLFTSQVEENVSVAVILNCMVATIARSGKSGRSAEAVDQPYMVRRDDGLIVVDYRDGILARYAEIVLARGPLPSSALVEGEHTVDIERRYHAGLPFPGDSRRRGMPRMPLRSPESRGMERTAFKTFLGELNPHAVEHAQMTEKFQELLRRADSSAMDAWGTFHNRCWVEPLDENTLPQCVLKALGEFGGDASEVHYVYDSRSDQLLLAVHTRTAERRHCSVRRTAVPYCNFRPAFASWPRMDLTRRPAMFQVEAISLRALERDVQYLYPADHAVIRVEQAPPVPCGVSVVGSSGTRELKHASVTVYKDGHVFGLRVAPPPPPSTENKSNAGFPAQFVAAWGHEHGTRTVVCQGPPSPLKPDGHGTMCVTNTCSCGLVVEHCSDGSVCQRYAVTPGQGTPPAARRERCRLHVGSSGAVVRVLADGRAEILHANGDVSTRESADCGYWTRTLGPRGHRIRVADTCECAKINEETLRKPELADVRLDPVSGAEVCTREDGTIVVTYTDGSMLARHSDGTTMLTTSRCSELQTVVVEAEGFATCTVYSGVDATARAHAKGARVAITRGGLRTRSMSVLPDGTLVELLYDTRITSNINGFVLVRKNDGTTVTAADNGTIKLRPVTSSMPNTSRRHDVIPGLSSADEADAGKGHDGDADGLTDELTAEENFGVYHFDCSDASVRVADPDNNVFRINDAVSHGLQGVDINLAGICDGVVAVPVINDPVHPRLFVMCGDGTGFELLREVDYRRYSSNLANGRRTSERAGHIEPHTFMEEIDGEGRRNNSNRLSSMMPLTVRQTDPFVVVDQVLFQTTRLVRVRNLVQYTPLGDLERGSVRRAEREYVAWKQEQAETEGRFNVDDPRPCDEKESEARMQRKIAKVRRRIERERKRSQIDRKLLGSPTTARTGIHNGSGINIAQDSGNVLGIAQHDKGVSIPGGLAAGYIQPKNEKADFMRAPVVDGLPELETVLQPALRYPSVRVPWDVGVTTGHFWASEEGKAFIEMKTSSDESESAVSHEHTDKKLKGSTVLQNINSDDQRVTDRGNADPVGHAPGSGGALGQMMMGRKRSAGAPPHIMSSTGFAPNYGVASHVPGAGARDTAILVASDERGKLGQQLMDTSMHSYASSPGRTNKGRAAEYDVVGNARARRVHTRSVRRNGLRGAPIPPNGGSIELFPGKVRFGSLLVGGSYRAPFEILNVSSTLQRYRVKPPRGISILHDPGALAPGMKKVVWVEILAHSCGTIRAELEVRSQYETFRLPISAEIVTAEHHHASEIAAGVLPT